MVGAYRSNMREIDDECLCRSLIFVDNIESTLGKIADLAAPLKAEIIEPEYIKADLFSMCEQSYVFECKYEDITIFKSVAHALENLTASTLIAEYVNTIEMQQVSSRSYVNL